MSFKTLIENIVRDNQIIVENIDSDKEQYFIERTNKHIELVKKAIDKIINNFDKIFPELAKKEWPENVSYIGMKNSLTIRSNIHDASKFEEPERTPYIDLTWNKFKGIKEVNPQINQATLYHIMNNKHHPEYWNKEEANLSKENREESEHVLDATKMSDVAVMEMVADWQAMSEELKTNTAREWYNKQKDVRWHFSPKQEDLIDRTLKIFETREPYHSMDMHDGVGEDDGW